MAKRLPARQLHSDDVESRTRLLWVLLVVQFLLSQLVFGLLIFQLGAAT